MALFGSSGIRGAANGGLLRLAFDLGLVVGGLHGSTLVGSDTRSTSPALKHALVSGLLAAGCRAYDVGIAPTPTVAYAARNFEAGAVITASHNPPQDNGLKLLNPDGSAFDAAQREKVEALLSEGAFAPAPWERMETCVRYETAVAEHLERILADFSPLPGVKVVLDCGCGAASAITPYLLQRMGCQAVTINCHPSGHFPRGIEPVPENLAELSGLVRSLGADLGLAHDGDGDRVAVVDEQGQFISGDKLLALLARNLGARRVVTTLDASMALEEMGFEVVRTRVGDAYVSEEIRKGGEGGRESEKGEIGGEASGCFIFPQLSLCPDGIHAAARVVDLASRARLSELVAELPSYPLRRGSLPAEPGAFEALERRLDSLKPLSSSNQDGVRLGFADGWVLVRRSGTEPRIRVTAEARTEERAQELYRLVLEMAQECQGERGRARP